MPEVRGHMSPSNDYDMYPILSYSTSKPRNGVARISYTAIMRVRWGPISWGNNTAHKVSCTGQTTQSKSGNVTNSTNGEIKHTVFTGSFDISMPSGGSKTVTLTWSNNSINASYSGTRYTGLSVSAQVTVSANPSYTKCKAPDSVSLNKTYVEPGGKITVSWRGAGGGTGNSIQRYYVQQQVNGGSWSSANPYNYNTSSDSGSLNVTLPNSPGATVRFQVRTEGSAGSTWYSGYTQSGNCTLYSAPTIPTCTVTKDRPKQGDVTINWQAGSAGTGGNTIQNYEIWYRVSSGGSSGPWGSRQRILNIWNINQRSYTWSQGIVGKWYQFCIVAIGSKYSYSNTNAWSSAVQISVRYTNCGAPSNFRISGTTTPIRGQQTTLSWGAGSGGVNNSVQYYEIQYSTNNGSSWSTLSSTISASSTSYIFNAPQYVGTVKYRIRTKGTAGSSYYSSWVNSSNSLSIKQADPPTSGSVTVALEDATAQGQKRFRISWSNFKGNQYNNISKYILTYQSSITGEEDTFGQEITISSNISSSTSSYLWEGGDWTYWYKFSIVAVGQYYGQSPKVTTAPIQKALGESDAPEPPSGFEYSEDGYVFYKDQYWFVPGSFIRVKPLGQTNEYLEYYSLEQSETIKGVKNNWRTIGNINPGESSSHILLSKDLTDGDFVHFRARAYGGGQYTNYFPSDEMLDDYQIPILNTTNINKNYPIIQIKRASSGTWTREDGRGDAGIILKEGELGYDLDNSMLKVGQNNSHFYKLLGVGQNIGDNNFQASPFENNVTFGTENKILNKSSSNMLLVGLRNIVNQVINTPFSSIIAGVDNVSNAPGNMIGADLTTSNNNNTYALICGRYNANTPKLSSPLFIVGGGTSASTRANILEVSKDYISSTKPIFAVGEIKIMPNGNYAVSDDDTNNDSDEGLELSKAYNLGYLVSSQWIQKNDDFNNYKKPGTYMVPLTETYKTLENRPENATEAGKLSVNDIIGAGKWNPDDPSYKVQTYRDLSGRVMNRSYYPTGDGFIWTNWGTLLNSRFNGMFQNGNRLYFLEPGHTNDSISINNYISTVKEYINYGDRNNLFLHSDNYIHLQCDKEYGSIVADCGTFAICGTGYSSPQIQVIRGSYGDGINAKGGSISAQTYGIRIYGWAQNIECRFVELVDNASVGTENYCVNSNNSLAVGYQCRAGNSANDSNTVAIGSYVTAYNHQLCIGKYNKERTGSTTDNTGVAFMVGNGSSKEARGNALEIYYNGKTKSDGSYESTGADYAEMFEWEDFNKDNEDRTGLFVSLTKDKIKLANKDDDYILGIISKNPSIVGDNPIAWHNKYMKDIFGNIIFEEKELEEISQTREIDGHKNKIVYQKAGIYKVPVLNPDYDPSQEYIGREDRSEWSYVGLLGKLVVIDDGTCEVDGYCWPSKNGMATRDIIHKKIRVMERLDDTHIRVLLK